MTIVLYFGTNRHWYGKKNIKGLMKIPEELNDYINDYEMKVFEIAWLTEAEIDRFHSDFKIVANFFVQKRKNKNYIPDDPTEIRHVDEVLKLLQVMTGDERYLTIFQEKKGVRSMCDVAERLEKMGMEKGKEEEKMEELLEILNEIDDSIDYENETALIDDQLLDSFAIITLVSELEDAFDISIEASEMMPVNFNSAKAIWAMVQRLQED